MSRYSTATLKRLLPPHNLSVAQVSKEEGINVATLYSWRSKLRETGSVVLGNQSFTGAISTQAYAIIRNDAYNSSSTC
ncbi:hypothetical protein MACH09_45440 [Vibrio sp. MACH09]|nr:hypothetical protein MACH09_45440 [Vibrio sp. MACH09]